QVETKAKDLPTMNVRNGSSLQLHTRKDLQNFPGGEVPLGHLVLPGPHGIRDSCGGIPWCVPEALHYSSIDKLQVVAVIRARNASVKYGCAVCNQEFRPKRPL